MTIVVFDTAIPPDFLGFRRLLRPAFCRKEHKDHKEAQNSVTMPHNGTQAEQLQSILLTEKFNQ
ncbi:MAG: hypothetical protein R2873_15530 [Caldilineaceae bacterium]